jgi:L-alanine-DL-glutamate epimerase-like enolase superfamily enzyme
LKLLIHSFDLPLRHPFTISRGTVHVQPTLIVRLEDQGCHGLGEATANSYYGHTIASMTTSIEAVRDVIESAGLWHEPPEELWHRLHPLLKHDLFALAAIDCAAHDLWGKLRGQAVHELWGLQTDRLPVSSYTLGIDSLDRMVEKLREMPGWPAYKIKLGTPHDVEIVRTIRRHTPATLRVDANAG